MADRLPSLFNSSDPIAVRPLQVSYDSASCERLLADSGVLAIIEFGQASVVAMDPRVIVVDLPQLQGEPVREVWRCGNPVQTGNAGPLRWSSDGDWCQFSISVAEADHADIASATRVAYAAVADFLRELPELHLLRLWNYFDAITEGDGDDERYRQFCIGRDQGLNGLLASAWPAATAIGSQHGRRLIQIYGLASRHAGVAVENPRQLSAWRYPRQYGPVAPGFARAMRSPDGRLLISGTAAIVGHRSQFDEDLAAQTDEMLANLQSLLGAAQASPAALTGEGLLLKAYVRGPDDVAFVTGRLRDALPNLAGLLVLGGVVCRRELVVEIDGVLG